ncbi:NAD(P)-dependent oxidoreductase [Haliea sp. E1-2-M8]|uniref:NAD(P)-dependent oxidoreductase n=1 Tax=Haliea sp. E1-2-M8 TaxID=3064706 RepID=UPI00272642F3|nr:NAD(P)-dependent oxidoreductase [Haliea sp. E1-2-M8]MDO8863788.1 NAD(P)-dependent oxidoreductase [Haliea sp. E1-2-M8]
MKALLHFRASDFLARRMRQRMPSWLELAIVDPEDEAGIKEQLLDTDVLFHVLAPADRALMSLAPNLKLIQKIGVGINTIDLDEAHRRGILVANMPGTNSQAVAEMTLGLMLTAMRKIVTFDQATRNGQGWSLSPETMDDVGEIGGKVVGLIGFGAVPQRLAPALTALGAKVIYCDRRASASPNGERVPMDDLIRRADIISLHVPLTLETQAMIGHVQLEKMKKGVILVNTARGELIDEQALYGNLVSRHVRCVGLDVLNTEPACSDNPLFTLPNVIVTPHVSWLTLETIERSLTVAVENCQLLLNGSPLIHQVPT